MSPSVPEPGRQDRPIRSIAPSRLRDSRHQEGSAVQSPKRTSSGHSKRIEATVAPQRGATRATVPDSRGSDREKEGGAPVLGPSLLFSPAKLHLLSLLLEGLDTVGAFAAALGISPSSIYQHLAALHGRGFVISSAHGRSKTYTFAPAVDQIALRRALLDATRDGTATRSGADHLNHLRDWAAASAAS
ncbi:ArsR/SmtB family transcription factor [Arthrobacter sp. B2a2-09]|uniref:ArsR/SmtB family transcription factor n=1 Tax=Arthrobacter sp. B2a2-09 TaxID=2952822 RepID=UPI0022CDAE92|nr:helix-turn-helix domain-containing protein [Arthrobacter sp. B2a2-09]MCZ9880635.1 helix-turn-helix domain-containing protein [Arthrobacter sp. B2a2-09]